MCAPIRETTREFFEGVRASAAPHSRTPDPRPRRTVCEGPIVAPGPARPPGLQRLPDFGCGCFDTDRRDARGRGYSVERRKAVPHRQRIGEAAYGHVRRGGEVDAAPLASEVIVCSAIQVLSCPRRVG
jgi:hypothetical protein